MSLLVTIDRSGLSLPDLVLSGSDDGNDLGVVNFTRPGEQMRYTQMPDSESVHGTEITGAALQQGILSFEYVIDRAADEAEVQSFRRMVSAAVQQFQFAVTTQEGNAEAEVWSANAGSVAPLTRTYMDLTSHNPVLAVQIPVYPIPGA